ncbi:hypothetical protein [Aquibacillus salsiterrae]|nr:hypothetical protein [Aquibacillus salsiterrae]
MSMTKAAPEQDNRVGRKQPGKGGSPESDYEVVFMDDEQKSAK